MNICPGPFLRRPVKVILKTRCGCQRQIELMEPLPPSYLLPMIKQSLVVWWDQEPILLPDRPNVEDREFRYRNRDESTAYYYEV